MFIYRVIRWPCSPTLFHSIQWYVPRYSYVRNLIFGIFPHTQRSYHINHRILEVFFSLLEEYRLLALLSLFWKFLFVCESFSRDSSDWSIQRFGQNGPSIINTESNVIITDIHQFYIFCKTVFKIVMTEKPFGL